MFLTDLQKRMVKDISDGTIRFVNDFMKIYIDIYNEEEKKKKIEEHDKIGKGVYGDDDRPIVKDKIRSRDIAKSFYVLIKKLEQNGIIILVKDGSKSSQLKASKYLSHGRHEHKEGTILEDMTLTKILGNISGFSYIPIADFSKFNEDFLTDDEREIQENKKRSDESLRYSRNTLFVTAAIAVTAMIVNIILFTNDRDVTITNPVDTVYVRIDQKDDLFQKAAIKLSQSDTLVIRQDTIQ